jgi:hypothetical protein
VPSRRRVGGARGLGGRAGVLHQRVVDLDALGGEAAHHREVALVHIAPHQRFTHRSCGLEIEREQQHARGSTIEAMHRIHPAPQLIAQPLQRGGTISYLLAAVHRQPRRLGDGHQPGVAMEDGQR